MECRKANSVLLFGLTLSVYTYFTSVKVPVYQVSYVGYVWEVELPAMDRLSEGP